MNIYVSNLSYGVNDDDLRQLFETFGEVSSAKVIMDRTTGRSRGFGFVEMSDNAEATKAIADLDKGEFDGKVISVSEARPKTDRPSSNFKSGGFKGGQRQDFKRRY